MADIPFSTFRGRLKQIDTTFAQPLMGQLYDTCFAHFDEVEQVYTSSPGKHYVTAAGTHYNFGNRPRRFAGGPGLPRGRYFALCDADSFNDRGTLRNELTAYYSGGSGLLPTIVDSTVDHRLVDVMRQSRFMPEQDLDHPFLLVSYRVARPTETNAALLATLASRAPLHQPFHITYAMRLLNAQVDRVVDLRDPVTQEWFLETFVGLELEHERSVSEKTNLIFMRKEPLKSVEQMLEVIVSSESGGATAFGQAVGQWLRRQQVYGLIYPSARSNAFVRVSSGTPVEWGGWNLVVYKDADPPIDEVLFGRMVTWRDRDHDHIRVQHIDRGQARGSFSIRGPNEFAMLEFDRRKQLAAGVRRDTAEAQITGRVSAELSAEVNRVLERADQNGQLWYCPVDYGDFVLFYERQWRDGMKPQ